MTLNVCVHDYTHSVIQTKQTRSKLVQNCYLLVYRVIFISVTKVWSIKKECKGIHYCKTHLKLVSKVCNKLLKEDEKYPRFFMVYDQKAIGNQLQMTILNYECLCAPLQITT